MLYERGVLAGDLPFEELRAQALINKRAQEAGDAPDFSQRIRPGLQAFNLNSGIELKIMRHFLLRVRVRSCRASLSMLNEWTSNWENFD